MCVCVCVCERVIETVVCFAISLNKECSISVINLGLSIVDTNSMVLGFCKFGLISEKLSPSAVESVSTILKVINIYNIQRR